MTSATGGDVLEMRVGPGLPALALRRIGAFVWIGTSAAAVAPREATQTVDGLVRWARVDLGAAARSRRRGHGSRGRPRPSG